MPSRCDQGPSCRCRPAHGLSSRAHAGRYQACLRRERSPPATARRPRRRGLCRLLPLALRPRVRTVPACRGLLRGQQGSGQRRAQRRRTKRRPPGATSVVAVRLRLFAVTRPSRSSVTDGSFRHGWPGSGPHSARRPGGLKDDCQSGSLDRQVSRRIKWRRTCHPRPCLSACRTASQRRIHRGISRLQRSARRRMPAHTHAGKQLQERQ